MKRSERKAVAAETLQILDRGGYRSSDRQVELGPAIDAAKRGTVLYRPEAELASVVGDRATRIEVTRESTLAAARRLGGDVGLEGQVVALNFASARNPGGGFLSGAQAQEESLARSSALYACIAQSELYGVHRASNDAMYTHHLIYSPAVPVFRDDDGGLLAEPWRSAFITAPAPNAGVVLERAPGRAVELAATLRERARRVLAIAAKHGHQALVLGAWGCGVFQNDPQQVATTFRELCEGPFRGAFDRVVFAVLDREGGTTLRSFREVFHV
jgi:uncharacterized protein (TIGR02452 family)